MQHSSADATSEHSDPQPVATGWRRTAQRLLLGLLLLSVAASIVPLKPDMPDRSLDGSWAWSMNQAVAQHLVFGRDIVFTFGPYASIYTRTYHPATDALMLGDGKMSERFTWVGFSSTQPGLLAVGTES